MIRDKFRYLPSSYHYLWLTLIVVIIDQWSKYLILKHLALFQSVTLLPLLNFTLVFNHGAAFSFLNSQDGWQRWFFIALAVAISGLILFWMSKTPKKKWLLSLALALILGGALANLWDRITLSYVIDFVDFHVNQWHFATFNVADSAITVGVILLILDLCFYRVK